MRPRSSSIATWRTVERWLAWGLSVVSILSTSTFFFLMTEHRSALRQRVWHGSISLAGIIAFACILLFILMVLLFTGVSNAIARAEHGVDRP